MTPLASLEWAAVMVAPTSRYAWVPLAVLAASAAIFAVLLFVLGLVDSVTSKGE